MKHTQLERRNTEIPQSLNSLPPLLARLYAARGISTTLEIEHELKHLADPMKLKGMVAALNLLTETLQADLPVMIIGDFDADGATSTTLAMKGLRAMGFNQLNYLIPNRFDFGYGLTPEIVDVAAEEEPALIITVDNGISSISGVERARYHGIDVLITDHHLPGEELPDAAAIINPNLPEDDFPSKNIAGVGVMFFLLVALRQRLRETGWFTGSSIAEPNLAQFLDIVALGTVADVVPLDQQNRILVEQGLRRIRAGRCTPGIAAIAEVAGRELPQLHSKDLGFFIGPRLNAAGRLEDMSWGIECLLTSDPDKAREYARDLDALNRERREIESGMQAESLQQLESLELDQENLPWGIALHQEGWHQGVVGLVASRIKERYYRPVIAFAVAENDMLKGSARSIPGLHIRDALERIDSQHAGMIEKFGGHAMAAGLSLPSRQLPAFSEAFDRVIKEMLSADQLNPVAISDGELPPNELNLETADLLATAAPWGQQFPEPLFDGQFVIQNKTIMKERHVKYSLTPSAGGAAVDGLVFGVQPTEWPETGETIHIAYTLNHQRFRGMDSLQLMIQAVVDATQ